MVDGYTEADLDIHPRYYYWAETVLAFLERVLKLHIHFHATEEDLKGGDIFLFNHFARFETLIPPYLIYRHTGAMSRSVASAEFFKHNDAVSALLRGLGAVPNDHPTLLPFLASEIVKGRKVIVFPEGGMVKDRRVIDREGYRVFSRMAKERRKHHTGAAVTALAVEVFKEAVRRARLKGRDRLLALWADGLGEGGLDRLFAFAERATVVVPANITFYPIRADDNLLHRAASILLGKMNERLHEEFRVEGNILLKNTDMDIHLGRRVSPRDIWTSWDRVLVRWAADEVTSLEDVFLLEEGKGGPRDHVFAERNRRNVLLMRDSYMRSMYSAVSIHLSHLASQLIMTLVERGDRETDSRLFHRTLYLCLKKVQQNAALVLHRSIEDPDGYAGLLEEGGRCRAVAEFFGTAADLDLVARKGAMYRFLPNLRREKDFDRIRIEDPIAVYANEVAPIGAVRRAVDAAIKEAPSMSGEKLASLLFDDEIRSFRYDRRRFSGPPYAELNRKQSLVSDTRPYLLKPSAVRGPGVLLIHGFSSSPGELRELGEKLRAAGHPVVGVRVKGHGTSPWDLKERGWTDWAASVQRGRAILSETCDRLILVGFSVGGLLALHSAAEAPAGLAAAVSVSAPIKLRDKGIRFVPLVEAANVLLSAVSRSEGRLTFLPAEPAHPKINYRHLPIRALHELERFIHEAEDVLGRVRCPVLVMQGTEDPTVDPKSALTILERLGSKEKSLLWIKADRHGILNENIGSAQEKVMEFVRRFSEPSHFEKHDSTGGTS